jgi:hypothetical protein
MDSRLLNGKRGLEVEVHAFLFCMDTQNIVVMIFGVKLEISPSAPRARFLYKVCATAQKMREGPSESACRSRLQTTLSCIGKEALW